jgi:PAS domain S-box-containing protein
MSDETNRMPDPWRARMAHIVMQPFALALANSAVPMVLCDATLEDYPIVFANASFLRLTRCTEDEVLGRNIRFLNAVDADPEDVRRVEDATVAGKVVGVDLHMTRDDGCSFWARMDLAPIFGPNGRVEMFVATLVDVSDRVRAVTGLRAAEDSFERPSRSGRPRSRRRSRAPNSCRASCRTGRRTGLPSSAR